MLTFKYQFNLDLNHFSRFKKYMQDPTSINKEWRDYFESKESEALEGPPAAGQPSAGTFEANQLATILSQVLSSQGNIGANQNATEVTRVLNLYRSYQTVGHEKANTDPLKLLESYGDILQTGRKKKNNTERLDYRFHGFSDDQLDKEIFIGKLLKK